MNRKVILRCIVGSGLHGVAIPGTDDRDEMGICLEHKDSVIGFKKFEQYIQRDQPEGVRSQPGDLDLTIYSLRKWCRLALGGNPSVILPLFAPKEYILELSKEGKELRQLYKSFLSSHCIRSFKGYLRSQRLRLIGKKGGRDINRPELVEKYGFDTKYAMHMLRLGMQGLELCNEGWIALPMKFEEMEYLLEVRKGIIPLPEILSHCDELEDKLARCLDRCVLPDEPDYRRIEEFVIEKQMDYWGK